MTDKKGITAYIRPWKPLTEFGDKSDSGNRSRHTESRQKNFSQKYSNQLLQELRPELIKLIWDIFSYPYSPARQRIKRSRLSGRGFEQAKAEGIEKGVFTESSAGRNKYLIATGKLFSAFNRPLPYHDEHSFYTKLIAYHLNKTPQTVRVETEVKLTNHGLSDVVTTAESGIRRAYEITLTTSNLVSNLEKYHNSSCVSVVFVARDYQLKQAVRAAVKESGLDPDLLALAGFTHIGQLVQRQRKLKSD